MKKILAILLTVSLILCSVPAFATSTQAVKTYVIANGAATGITRVVPSSVISPKSQRILGMTVVALHACGASAAWYDAEVNADTNAIDGSTGYCPITYLEVELEASLYAGENSLWFIYPREVERGMMMQLAAYTTLIIYFEDYYGH